MRTRKRSWPGNSAEEGEGVGSMTNGNIILCGFMGCGKTSVGRRAAKLLGRKFCDLDQ